MGAMRKSLSGVLPRGAAGIRSLAAIFVGIADPVKPFSFQHLALGLPSPQVVLFDDGLREPVNLYDQFPQLPADSPEQFHEDFPALAGGSASRR